MRTVVKPKITWKFVGDEKEAQERLDRVYDRIFTIATENIRARKQKEAGKVDLKKIPKEYEEFPGFIAPRAMFGSAVQFLHLVESVLNESLEQKNNNWYHGDPISSEDFDYKTRWADLNLIRPVLFNFYHGLELLMKGLLLTVGQQVSPNHRLDKLLKDVTASRDIPKDIKATLQEHLDSKGLLEPMKSFTNQNNIPFSKLYEYLRYPLNKEESQFPDYDVFEYQGEKLLPYFEKVIKDSYYLRIKGIEFFRTKARKKPKGTKI